MAAISLFVYARRGHLELGLSGMFALMLAIGSLIGSRLAPLIPLAAFPWLLALTCPILLYVVWQRELWLPTDTAVRAQAPRPFAPAVLISGLVCRIYDGVFGPGAGTFMFLSLLFFAHLPLLTSLAAAKLANTASAAVALASYAQSGNVHWRLGAIAAAGAIAGAYFGARQASQKAARIVRPALVVVVVLLILRILTEQTTVGPNASHRSSALQPHSSREVPPVDRGGDNARSAARDADGDHRDTGIDGVASQMLKAGWPRVATSGKRVASPFIVADIISK